MSDKIKPHHLARKAILYVRQSSRHQVLHSRESQALQYAVRAEVLRLDPESRATEFVRTRP